MLLLLLLLLAPLKLPLWSKLGTCLAALLASDADGEVAAFPRDRDVLVKELAAHESFVSSIARVSCVTVRVCCDKDPFKPPPSTFSCDCDGPPHAGDVESPQRPFGYSSHLAVWAI